MPENTIANKVIAFLQQEETDYAAAAKLGEDAMPVLKSIISGTDEALASKATCLAGMIDSDQRTEVLTEAALHPSIVVRIAAAAATQQLEPDQAEQVLSHLVDDNDIGVSKYTLQSIQAKNLSSHFKARLEKISDTNPNEAIKTLAKEALKNVR